MGVCRFDCPSASACQGACARAKALPLTFWHVAGDIIWRGDGRPVPICVEQAHALRGLFSDETRSAYRVGKIDEAARIAGLWVELGRALDALAEYRRLFGAPDPWAQAA